MNNLVCSALRFTLATVGFWAAAHALAGPLPSALSVQASLALDIQNSFDPVGQATQSVDLSLVAGGVTTGTGIGVPGTVPAVPTGMSGALTQTGDGLRARFSMASDPGGAGLTNGLFADFLFELTNNSVSQTITVVFLAEFSNQVAAQGRDSFAYSDISVRDGDNNELLFSDHRADTSNPGENFALDSAGSTFSVVLSPGASTSIAALQRQRGGNVDGLYQADLNAGLWIQAVRISGDPPPNEVPLPGTLYLALAALVGLGWRRAMPGR